MSLDHFFFLLSLEALGHRRWTRRSTDLCCLPSGAGAYVKLPPWESWKTRHGLRAQPRPRRQDLWYLQWHRGRTGRPGSAMWVPEEDKVKATVRLLWGKVGGREEETKNRKQTEHLLCNISLLVEIPERARATLKGKPTKSPIGRLIHSTQDVSETRICSISKVTV